jgi:hypothetical protein
MVSASVAQTIHQVLKEAIDVTVYYKTVSKPLILEEINLNALGGYL